MAGQLGGASAHGGMWLVQERKGKGGMQRAHWRPTSSITYLIAGKLPTPSPFVTHTM